MTYRYYVWTADFRYAADYATKAEAMAHAERIGGTWKKQRR